jgi:hypothetical protein
MRIVHHGFVLLGLALVLAGCVNPLKHNSAPANVVLNVHEQSSCNSSTGNPTTCTVTLQNEASSNVSFDWTTSSNPAGATFTPSSGSVAAGATSDPIQVSIPDGLCPDQIAFVDNGHNTEVTDNINTACQ